MRNRLTSLAYIFFACGAFALAKAIQLPAWLGFMVAIAIIVSGMLIEGFVRDQRYYGRR